MATRPLKDELAGAIGEDVLGGLYMEGSAGDGFTSSLVGAIVWEIVLHKIIIVLARTCNTFELHRLGLVLVDGSVVLDGVTYA